MKALISVNENSSAKSKKGSINKRLHLFAKDEKEYPFYQLALVATRRKRVPFFINFAVTQNDLARVLNFKM